ncbi:MAG: anaerobic selenocysteine-containing dehydrogenase [Planctomycetota bacterium]
MSTGKTIRQDVQSACPLDCPDGCSVVVTLEDERVVAMNGSQLNPLTAGFLCEKVRRFADHVYCKERVPYPLIREVGAPKGQPGGLRRASWDEALGLIAERMAAVAADSGPEAILPLHFDGSNGPLTSNCLDQRLFRRLGATKLETTVCAAPTGAAAQGTYGKMPGIALEDYRHSNLIVAWGANPASSGTHFLPGVLKAQKRGAKFVVIDPRRTRTARQADVHLALRPGTDLVLALAVIRWLVKTGNADLEFLAEHATGFDELMERADVWNLENAARVTGLTVREIEDFAKLYAASTPAAIRCGWGLERNRNGGQAVCAVLALPAVAGKFGVLGGGYTMSNNRGWALRDLTAGEPTQRRALNQNKVGRALTEAFETPIKFVFAFNHNPAETLPDLNRVRAGLSKPGLFTVVFDAVMTASANYADVVLPATTFLEHDELVRPYGAYALQRTRPVIAPVGESRSNLEVFGELIERLGLSKPGDVTDADGLVELLLEGQDDVLAALAEKGIAFPSCGQSPVQFVDVFPMTDDRKVHLFPVELDEASPVGLYIYREDPATAEYPLALVSPSTGKRTSSTFGQLHRKIVPLEIHPKDAEERGIEEGDTVRVHNELGELRTLATLTDVTRRGVLVLPKGLWAHNTLDGNTSNMLTPDSLSDLAGGAVFNDARVDVELLERSVDSV